MTVERESINQGGEYIDCTNKACAATSVLMFSIGEDVKPLLAERWNKRAAHTLLAAQGDLIGKANEMVECDALNHIEDARAMVPPTYLELAEIARRARQWNDDLTTSLSSASHWMSEMWNVLDKIDGAPVQAAPDYVPEDRKMIAILREALQFYANGDHFTMHDPDAWDTVSGEPANFYEDESNTATVEDGSIAKLALAGIAMPEDDQGAPVQQEGVVSLRAERVKGSTMYEWRKNISPALNGSGDVVLCWVNEGDLCVSELRSTNSGESQP